MMKISMNRPQIERTIEETYNDFLAAAAAKGIKAKTLETYRYHFRSIAKRMDVRIPIARLTKSDLDDMIIAMRNEGLSDSSINSYTRTLKTFLSWCNSESLTTVNIRLYKASESVKETYTDEELLKLLQRPDSKCRFTEFRNWVIINFLVNSGARAATVRNIQIKDVDLLNKTIYIRHSKNGKTQVIPLCSRLVVVLREYMSIRGGGGSDYLFCNEFGELFSEDGLRNAIAKYNRSRGVARTSLHAFRHTFARKYLVDCGGNAFMLQKLLGHSTLAMTKHYCAIFDADIAKDYDNFSPLAQLQKQKQKISKK